jgi:hypothetical protein
MLSKILRFLSVCAVPVLAAVQLSACGAPGDGSSPASTTTLLSTVVTTATVTTGIPATAPALTVTGTQTIAVTYTVTTTQTRMLTVSTTAPASFSLSPVFTPTAAASNTSAAGPTAPTSAPTTPVYSPPVSGFADPVGDTFDASGNPAPAEACIDIRDAGVSLTGSGYSFNIRVVGEIPLSLNDQAKAMEWDFFIDADKSGTTGEHNSLFINDIGAEYLLRLLVHGLQSSAELIDLVSLQAVPVSVTISGNAVIFNLPGSALNSLAAFDCVALARSWQNSKLVAADKTPGQGSYNFSN